jgi:hypothetical protein
VEPPFAQRTLVAIKRVNTHPPNYPMTFLDLERFTLREATSWEQLRRH